MKSKNIFFLVFFSSVILLAAIHQLGGPLTERQNVSLRFGIPASIGTKEDANARNNWELMRLQDPATGGIPDHIRQKELAYAATLPGDEFFYLGKNASSSSLTWTARGPWNAGGKTRALAIDVTNENIILAASTSGGMWRSTDGGLTWKETTALTQNQSVTCVAQDTRKGHANTWYYGGGEVVGASASKGSAFYSGNGVYKSTDGGLTWNSLPSTDAGTPQFFYEDWDAIWSIATDPSDTLNDVVYAATVGTLYRSVDGGVKWIGALGDPLSPKRSIFTDVKVTSSGVVYAAFSSEGPQKGIWRSTDGITFTNITPVSFPATYERIVIGVAPSDENQVYFLANTPGAGTPCLNFLEKIEWNSLWKYTYLSGDGSGAGGNWEDRSAGIPSSGQPYQNFFCQGSYDMLIRVKPDDPNTVFIGGTNLYRSTNGYTDQTQTKLIGGYKEAYQWPPQSVTLVSNYYSDHYPDQHELVFLPSNPNIMFSANDRGVFKTMDNLASTVAWIPLTDGYMNTMFYTIAIDHATPGDNTIIGGTQDLGSWYTNSSDIKIPWTLSADGDGAFCAIADNKTSYYFSMQNGWIHKAVLDASGNATAFARIDPIGGKDYLFINPFVLDPNNNNIMYVAGGKRIWRNNDLSGIPLVNNWDSISTNWTAFPDTVPITGSIITAVTACKTPANRLYYGTNKGKIYRIDKANTGTPSPVDVSTNVDISYPFGANLSCIAVDPRDGNKVMAVFSNYSVYSLYYSENGGSSWSKAAGNIEQFANGSGNGPSCRWVSILPVSDGVVYLLGTSTGLYATDTLQGTSTVWVQQGVNTIGNIVCDMIDTRPSDGLVVVATHGHGIYSTNITSIKDIASGQKELTKGTNDFHLKNYPNPFRQSTTIEFALDKKTKVAVKILDELGREVAILSNEELTAGKHSLQFNKGNLSGGIYYCLLETEGYRKTQKMLLVE